MSISSVSASELAAASSNFVSNSQIAKQNQALTTLSTSAEVTASSQTTVTLSSTQSSSSNQAPFTYDQIAANVQSQGNIGITAQLTSENSITILMTGQNNMAAAMDSFSKDWTTVQQTIGSQRPDLLNQQWDFNTDNGTIQVVSNTISSGDKAWLTGVLNQNKGLVADTQSINTILVSTFGGTATDAAEDPTDMTLSALTQSTVDGKVHFLSLMEGVDNGTTGPFTGLNLLRSEVAGGLMANAMVAGEIKGDSVNSSIQAAGDLVHGEALNVAYIQYLYPALAGSSVQDGTADPVAGLNVSPNDQHLVQELSTARSGMMLDTSGAYNDQSQDWLARTQPILASYLGANYRTYGETLNSESGSSATSASSSTAATSITSGVSSGGTPSTTTSTGVGAIQDIYQAGETTLTAAQSAIQPAMQSLGQDWNTTKATIAAVRPELLSQNWDFVTDNGTVQAVSTGSGSPTDEQKSWLTGILNQNTNLVADTQTINKDLVNFYDKAAAGNAKVGVQPTGSNTLANLTEQSIDGTISFLALMGGADPGEMIQQGLNAKASNSNYV